MNILRNSTKLTLATLTWVLALTPAVSRAVALSDLFNGQTLTANDKIFKNWTQVDLATVNGGFSDPTLIDVTPLINDPLDPGVKYTAPSSAIGTPFGHTGPSSVILTFSFDVQTTNQQPLIKDNSLLINNWLFDASPNAFIQITEDVLNSSNVKLGDKLVVARSNEQPPGTGVPTHFDTLTFTNQSLVHIVTRIEIQGPGDNDGGRLEGFEQRFSEIVPEPSGEMLAGFAAIGLVGYWSRKRSGNGGVNLS